MKSDLGRGETTDKEHGRLEQRLLTTSNMLCGQIDWPGLKQDFKIEREVEELSISNKSKETAYVGTSLSDKQADAEKLMEIVLKHCMIENGLHYRRDRALREDYCRLRIGEAAKAMIVINNLIVGLALR